MSTITIKIDGTPITIRESTPQIQQTLDMRDVCSFTVRDDAGTANYQPGQKVEVTDSVAGRLFSGFINDAKKVNTTPNTTNFIAIQCSDNTSLADRATSKKDYQNQYTGDIACDLHANYLASEGVIARYALRRDTTTSNFNTGTRSNTVGASTVGDGDLELSRAGSQVVTSGAGAGFTLGNGLKLTGYCSSGYSTAYVYRQIWTGSITIVNNDYLTFDVWISSDSPQIKASVNITCSDGTTLNSSTNTDNQGLSLAIATDLSGLANDTWFSRQTFFTGGFVGKTIVSVEVALGGTNAGTYIAYFRRIVYHSSGTTTIFGDNTTLTTNNQIANNGYSNVSLTQVSVEDKTALVTHASLSIDAAKIVKDSSMTYSSLIPDGCTGLCETSVDNGASWQRHTSGTSIPNLLAGMSVAGRVVRYRHTMTIGKDPTVAIGFGGPTLIVNSAYNATKSDSISTYTTATDFNTGTLTDVKTVGSTTTPAITTNGFQWSYANGFPSQTFYGSGGTSYINKQQIVSANASADGRLRLDFAGQWQNFVAEVDVQVPSSGNVGFVYRTTGWQNNSDTYAYAISILTTKIELGKGTNSSSGAGSYTALLAATLTLAANSVHRLKIVVSGNSHQVYLDGVRYLNVTDSTWTAAGYMGLRVFNSGGSTLSLPFANFGICSALTGTWQSPSIDISGPGTYGNSIVIWDEDGIPDSTCAISAQTSIDSGSTWQSVTNGGAISGLSAGSSLAGKHLLIKMTLTASNAPVVPVLNGVTAWVMGQYSASGTRITPALSLDSVGRAGSTLVSWNGNVFSNTTLSIDTGLDGSSWTNAGSGASGSAAIAGITVQPSPTDDTFDSNTSSSYTSTARTGGSTGTWTWDTTNSRVSVSGGTNALLLFNTLSTQDVDIIADLDQSDAGGIVWRVQNVSNFYELDIFDASSSAGSTNVLKLFKIVANVKTQLGSNVAIAFTRNTPKRVRVTMLGTAITVYFDGTQVLSTTDGSLGAAGQVGLSSLSGSARFYQLRVQPQGDDVTGKVVYTRTTLTSTDPTLTPQLTDLTVSVRNPNIGNGALIPSTQYSILSGSKNTLAADYDDQAKQSNYYWLIDKNLELFMQARAAQPSPWILTGVDVQVANVSLENISDLYRNDQWLNGGKDTLSLSTSFVGTGSITNWTMGYPVDSVSSITVNGVAATFGVKNVDTGKDFYYEVGSLVIIPDASASAYIDSQTIVFAYSGQVNVVTEVRNDSQIAARAAIDKTDGIIQDVESVDGLNKLAMLQLAQGRLDQYAMMGRTLTCTTMRDGLAPGQLLPVFLSQFGVQDGQFLITDVSTIWVITVDALGNEKHQPFHSVTATDGALVGDWVRWLMNLADGRN